MPTFDAGSSSSVVVCVQPAAVKADTRITTERPAMAPSSNLAKIAASDATLIAPQAFQAVKRDATSDKVCDNAKEYYRGVRSDIVKMSQSQKDCDLNPGGRTYARPCRRPTSCLRAYLLDCRGTAPAVRTAEIASASAALLMNDNIRPAGEASYPIPRGTPTRWGEGALHYLRPTNFRLFSSKILSRSSSTRHSITARCPRLETAVSRERRKNFRGDVAGRLAAHLAPPRVARPRRRRR